MFLRFSCPVKNPLTAETITLRNAIKFKLLELFYHNVLTEREATKLMTYTENMRKMSKLVALDNDCHRMLSDCPDLV